MSQKKLKIKKTKIPVLPPQSQAVAKGARRLFRYHGSGCLRTVCLIETYIAQRNLSTLQKIPLGNVRSGQTDCTQTVRTQIWKSLRAPFAAAVRLPHPLRKPNLLLHLPQSLIGKILSLLPIVLDNRINISLILIKLRNPLL